MTKVSTIIFVVLWMITLPIVILSIGFAGNKLWLPSEIYDEIANGRFQGLFIRLGFFLYFLSPVLVFRSYRNRWK